MVSKRWSHTSDFRAVCQAGNGNCGPVRQARWRSVKRKKWCRKRRPGTKTSDHLPMKHHEAIQW
jgi:SRSO17 transposase